VNQSDLPNWATEPSTRTLFSEFKTLLGDLPLTKAELSLLDVAAETAANTHLGQHRPDGSPYINHPINVAISAVSKFRVSNSSLLIAALLHDTVEDRATVLIETLNGQAASEANHQDQALECISVHFGSRAAEVVGRLTNPEFAQLASIAQANGDSRAIEVISRDLYKEHFLEILEQDPEAFLIKLADFGENALKLAGLEDQKRASLALKYGPVIVATISALNKLHTNHLLYNLRDGICSELSEAYERDYR
jgi:(p)ppGpp synthase/HD superfamily hydrolase